MPLTDLDFHDVRRRRARDRQRASGGFPSPLRIATVAGLGSMIFLSALAASAMIG